MIDALNLVTTFGADPTGRTLCDKAFIDAASSGKSIYLPSGKYRTSITWGLDTPPLADGVCIFGNRGADNGWPDLSKVSGSVILYEGTRDAIRTGTFINANRGGARQIRDLVILGVNDANAATSANDPTFTAPDGSVHRCGAGISMVGDCFVELSGVYVGGFPVSYMLDGAECCSIVNCRGVGKARTAVNTAMFSAGIWIADTDGGNGWTVPGSVNVNHVERCDFAGSNIGIQIDAAAALRVVGCRTTLYPGVDRAVRHCFARINRGNVVSFRGCYTEGGADAGTAHYLFEKRDGSSSAPISNVTTIAEHFGAGNCPPIMVGAVSVQGLTLDANMWTSAQCKGMGRVVGYFENRPSTYSNPWAPGTPFLDVAPMIGRSGIYNVNTGYVDG
jgi:hypothetical protein